MSDVKEIPIPFADRHWYLHHHTHHRHISSTLEPPIASFPGGCHRRYNWLQTQTHSQRDFVGLKWEEVILFPFPQLFLTYRLSGSGYSIVCPLQTKKKRG